MTTQSLEAEAKALNDKIEAARAKPEIFAEFRKANARKFRGFEAPEGCIKAIEAAVALPFEEVGRFMQGGNSAGDPLGLGG